MIHYLKIWPLYFEQVRLRRKRFEIRKDDRGFMLGDQLCLQEWVPKDDHDQPEGATGRFCFADVLYLMRGPAMGLEAGHVIMSIDLLWFLEPLPGNPPFRLDLLKAFLKEHPNQVPASAQRPI